MGTTLLLLAMAAAYAYYVWDLGRDTTPRRSDVARPTSVAGVVRLRTRERITPTATPHPAGRGAATERRLALN